MNITIDRIYGTQTTGGYRILVDRLWPRGVSKQKADLNEWCKDIAPTTELRQWFGHRPERYAEFYKKYTAELNTNSATTAFLHTIAAHKNIILLYGAKDTQHNEAVVLRDYIVANLP